MPDGEVFKCDVCGKECGNKASLGSHKWSKHQIAGSHPYSVYKRRIAAGKITAPSRKYTRRQVVIDVGHDDNWWLVQAAIDKLQKDGVAAAAVLNVLSTLYKLKGG
jgi:hypothetical protein